MRLSQSNQPMGTAALKRKPQVVYQSLEGPTIERRRHAEGFYEIAGEDRASQKYTMQDSPLDRLWAREGIDQNRYIALNKYYHHWRHGGLSDAVGSMDLNRVFATDPTNFSGLSKSENQAFHRQQYRNAKTWLARPNQSFDIPKELAHLNNYEHKMGIVIDNIVICEWPLHIAGHSIGYESPYRARRAATEILRDAGYRLAKLWGIG